MNEEQKPIRDEVAVGSELGSQQFSNNLRNDSFDYISPKLISMQTIQLEIQPGPRIQPGPHIQPKPYEPVIKG